MTILAVPAAVGSLRQRLLDDMTLRRFSRETQRNYIRDVGRLATFLRRSPDTATGAICAASRSPSRRSASACPR
jgi:integrase/recombinase XerD